MATHQLAQGLASLGRHGDSMLMHVSPSEVAGLKAIGSMTGHKLHTNPRTGMPEAFDFGDFFSSLLPTLAGFMVGGPAGAGLGLKAGTTAATLAPIAAGVATGAAVAGAKGEDVLAGGLMGGLGGYGGGNMGNAFRAATNPGITNAISGNIGDSLISQADDLASNTALNTVKGGKAGIDFSQLAQGAGAPGVTLSPSDLAKGALSETRGVLPSFTPQAAGGTSSMMDTAGRFVENLGGAGPAAVSLGAPTLMAGYQAGMFTPQLDTSLEEKRKAEENKYVDQLTGKLNPYQARPDFGTRLMATGGTVNTNSSTISSGGIQDLYGTNDQTTGTQNLSKDGYGIGRLNTLAAEGSRAKAADTFYAAGGPVAFAEGGSSRIYIPGYNDPVASQGSLGSNPLLALLAQIFAKQGVFNAQANTPAPAAKAPSAPMTINPMNEPGMYPQASKDYMATKATDKGTFALEAAKGGYLDGAGDGMSDSIPGTIEGKQPARLADGEFVIPADVVSHIGNGSSKAGSKQLYTMLDRIRKARTGHTKQGKEIKPQKYMPA
jgi:hypothetical protein